MYFPLLGLILFGCSKKITSNEIIGNWWSIEEDSTYSEMYVNGAEWVFNHESYGPIPYEYELLKDSVFIFFSRSENKKGWKIAQTCDSILILSNNKEKRVLHKFDLKYSYFEALKDSLVYEEFEMDFIGRYLIRK